MNIAKIIIYFIQPLLSGKGVYFADMVSKSANYCNTSSANNTGLLLLCEVALGDMWVVEKMIANTSFLPNISYILYVKNDGSSPVHSQKNLN